MAFDFSFILSRLIVFFLSCAILVLLTFETKNQKCYLEYSKRMKIFCVIIFPFINFISFYDAINPDFGSLDKNFGLILSAFFLVINFLVLPHVLTFKVYANHEYILLKDCYGSKQIQLDSIYDAKIASLGIKLFIFNKRPVYLSSLLVGYNGFVRKLSGPPEQINNFK